MSQLKYGAFGSYLIRRYFNSYKDIVVIGSDTNWRVYSAWLSYLRDNNCFQNESSPLANKLADIIEFIDLFLPFEETEDVLQKLEKLGRKDPNYLDCLTRYYRKEGKEDYAIEVSIAEEFYYGFIDDFKNLLEGSVKNRNSIVIWTPV